MLKSKSQTFGTTRQDGGTVPKILRGKMLRVSLPWVMTVVTPSVNVAHNTSTVRGASFHGPPTGSCD